MKYWPLPDSYNDRLPIEGEPGAFWEDRGDRRHCGIDIYGPPGSEVIAIDSGVVIGYGVYTTKELKSYFRTSYFLTLKCEGSLIYKYAGLNEPTLKLGSSVKGGERIGELIEMLDLEKVNYDDEFYIREIAFAKSGCKLHLEIYKAPFIEVQPYESGNYLGPFRPQAILDPALALRGVSKRAFTV